MDLQDPQYKGADGSAIRVFRDAAANRFLTEKYGRPIFDDVVFAEVIAPGSRDSTPVFELVRNFAAEMERPDPRYGAKYPEYQRYVEDFEKKEATDTSLAGTPLEQWSEMKRSMVLALKGQNIFTVDALASLPDGRLLAVGLDGRTWREKAKAYVENAKGSAYATQLAADLERASVDKADLQAQVKDLAAQVQALTLAQAAAKAPGRAAKAPAEVHPSELPPEVVIDPLAASEAPAAQAGAGETLVPAVPPAPAPII